MADKDFQVKNGLIINSNNYGGANKFTVNASALWFGNTSANVSINSTSININGLTVNSIYYPARAESANTANNTAFVGTVTAANVVSNLQLQENLSRYSTTSTIISTYQTMAGLSANVATLTSANSTRLNAKTEGNLNVNNALTANLATFSTTAALVGNNGSATGSSFTFNYTPQLGIPSYVWGTNDGVTFRPYNPTNFIPTTIQPSTISPGTVGQALVTGTGGTVWASGGWTLLNTTTITSAISSYDLTSIFTSAYSTYMVEIINLIPSNSGSYFYGRVYADGAIRTANYNFSIIIPSNYNWADNSNQAMFSWFNSISNNATNGGISGHLIFQNPSQTATYKGISGNMNFFNTNGSNIYFHAPVAFQWRGGANAITGFQLFFTNLFGGGSNIVSGTVKVYGKL